MQRRRGTAPLRRWFSMCALVVFLPLVAAMPARAADDAGWTGNDFHPIPANANDGKHIADPQLYHWVLKDALHVPLEYADENGFWYAKESIPRNGPKSRPLQWTYQSYGVWCTSPSHVVGYNNWLDRWACMVDTDHYARTYEGWDLATENCRTAHGPRPWAVALPDIEDGVQKGWVCDESMGDPESRFNLLSSHGGVSAPCAPWEDQTYDAYGYLVCTHVWYEWMNDPQGRVGYHPPYASQPDPEPTTFTAKETVTEKASFTAKAAPRMKATVTVRRAVIKRKHAIGKGKKRVVAQGKAPINVKRTAAAKVTRTATRTVTVSHTSSCTRDTKAAAKSCAQTQARNAARKAAQSQAKKAARQAARDLARQAGLVQARKQARAAAMSTKIRPAVRRKAIRLAKQRAIRNAKQKVRARAKAS